MSTFLFDIDGTLRNFEPESDIDPDLLNILLTVKKLHPLYAITGRTFQNFKNFVKELKKGSNLKEFTGDIFKSVFCEDGHVYYEHGNKKLLISNQAEVQLRVIKEIISSHVKNQAFLFHIRHPSPDLIAEASIVVQGDDSVYKYKEYLGATIKEKKLNLLTVKSLTHNRLAICVKDVDKNSAILAQGIDLADMYYFCDEINDLILATSIVKNGGKIICPFNAVDQIKKIAHYVSSKPYSYGVTDYLSIFLKTHNDIKI